LGHSQLKPAGSFEAAHYTLSKRRFKSRIALKSGRLWQRPDRSVVTKSDVGGVYGHAESGLTVAGQGRARAGDL